MPKTGVKFTKLKMSKRYKSNLLNEGYNNNPILFDKAKGSIIYSRKRKYIDLSNGAGTIFLGHNNTVFRKSLIKYLNLKLSNFAHPNIAAHNFSLTLKKVFPEYSKFIFCNTGAEANLKAIRIAKAITKKNLIVNVTGSWHGSIDQLLFNSGKNLKKISLSDGIDPEFKKNLVYIPYNDIANSKKILNKYKKKICSVLVEPIQGGLPTKTSEKYLKFLSEYCKKKGIILIFDEVLSGVRFNCSSLHSIFKIKPNISTFGKIIGGGLPIGLIGIDKSVEKKISSKKLRIFFGGTHSGNSLSTYVGNDILSYILKNKNKIFNKIESQSNKFENQINNFVKKNNIDVRIIRFDSLIRIVFSKKSIANRLQRDFFEKKKYQKREKFIAYLRNKGIFFPTNGVLTFTYSLTNQQLNYLISTITKSLKKFFS